MFRVYSIRIATFAALGVLSVLWSAMAAGQAPRAGAAATLEVKVLEAQVSPDAGQGERPEAIYRMEVISVLSATIRVKPGDIIMVRTQAPSTAAQDKGLRPRGWIGVAYLNPDPKAGGSEAPSRFVAAANGRSFEDLPPTPPSLKWTEYPRQGAE
ncbi:hypothetical protein [Thiocystis violacea]|uniref:hypothetical protein n=1 Tax=Thiocystis violacea TaxID=13725 RepID=UPI001902DCD7|nr:hypothetical protein [Thiocystis violacea]MBK1723689.1 hypothetical protein [Thiocystis violacea]